MSTQVWRLMMGMTLALASQAQQAARAAEEVRGQKLLLNGGGAEIPKEGFELMVRDAEASFKRLGSSTGAKHPLILVVLYSSQIPDEYAVVIRQRFEEVGAKNVKILLRPPGTAPERQAHRELIEQAHAVFFGGGDQNKHKSGLVHGELWDAIQEAYWVRKIMVGGTSAGCAIMSEIMIEGDIDKTTGKVPVSEGLGFLPGTVVDQHHFVERERMPRFLQAYGNAPRGYSAVAVAEDGAVFFERVPGSSQFKATIIGTKPAWLIQGKGSEAAKLRMVTPGETFIHDYEGISSEGCNANLSPAPLKKAQ